MRGGISVIFRFACAILVLVQQTNGALDEKTQSLVNEANKKGPYIGLVVPNLYELNLFDQSPSFISTNLTIEFSGKRFRFGKIEGKNVILVMTGLAMLNAGVTTQLLLSIFKIEGVVHYGIATNANPSFHTGDITIPQYWSHTTLWNWQRYGYGPKDELPLEVNGDYTREIGYLSFGDYTNKNSTNFISVKNSSSNGNKLNNVWYQPEEVFPIDATPEKRQHAFWVPVDPHYFNISKSLQKMKLERCINSTTCLAVPPKVTTVERGATANIYLDNAAYRNFMYNKFNVTPVEMESAAVALICYQQKVPFIVFRALSHLAGGGDSESNDAVAFTSLVANNAVEVVIEFIKKL